MVTVVSRGSLQSPLPLCNRVSPGREMIASGLTLEQIVVGANLLGCEGEDISPNVAQLIFHDAGRLVRLGFLWFTE